jgi:hypothetical protein
VTRLHQGRMQWGGREKARRPHGGGGSHRRCRANVYPWPGLPPLKDQARPARQNPGGGLGVFPPCRSSEGVSLGPFAVGLGPRGSGPRPQPQEAVPEALLSKGLRKPSGKRR